LGGLIQRFNDKIKLVENEPDYPGIPLDIRKIKNEVLDAISLVEKQFIPILLNSKRSRSDNLQVPLELEYRKVKSFKTIEKYICEKFNLLSREKIIEELTQFKVAGEKILATHLHRFSREKPDPVDINNILLGLVESKWISEMIRQLNELDVSADKKSNKKEVQFNQFFKKDFKIVYPVLLRLYTKAKPIHYAMMLFALWDLGILNFNPGTFSNKTELFEAVEKVFGNIGTRQSFSNNLSNLNRPTTRQNNQMEGHRNRIKGALEPL
jgi:hypothetical protein